MKNKVWNTKESYQFKIDGKLFLCLERNKNSLWNNCLAIPVNDPTKPIWFTKGQMAYN